MKRRPGLALTVVVLLAPLAACAAPDPQLAGENEHEISQVDTLRQGVSWPFAMTPGFVVCDPRYEGIGFRPIGSHNVYAINDIAAVNNRGVYRSVSDIIRPDLSTYRDELRSFLGTATSLCGFGESGPA